MKQKLTATVTKKINLTAEQLFSETDRLGDLPFTEAMKVLEDEGKTSLHAVSVGLEDVDEDNPSNN